MAAAAAAIGAARAAAAVASAVKAAGGAAAETGAVMGAAPRASAPRALPRAPHATGGRAMGARPPVVAAQPLRHHPAPWACPRRAGSTLMPSWTAWSGRLWRATSGRQRGWRRRRGRGLRRRSAAPRRAAQLAASRAAPPAAAASAAQLLMRGSLAARGPSGTTPSCGRSACAAPWGERLRGPWRGPRLHPPSPRLHPPFPHPGCVCLRPRWLSPRLGCLWGSPASPRGARPPRPMCSARGGRRKGLAPAPRSLRVQA